jgi:hypothetical protein
MSKVRGTAWLFAIFLAVSHAATLRGAEYTVQFNCWERSGSGGCRKEFGGIHPGIDSTIFDWSGWTSLGDSRGSRIPNYSGKAIRAFHIKVDGTDDTFKVPPGAGGVLFPEVWRRKNGKEVIFNVAAGGAGIAPGARFWSLVNPQTPGYPVPYFQGKAFEERQPAPDPGEWEQVPAAPSRARDFPIARFPSAYREIRAYAGAAGGGTLLVSDDDVLWLDRRETELRAVRFAREIPAGVDRITVSSKDGRDGEEFVLWKGDAEVLRLPVAKLSFWPENLLGRK